jgi:hypothetical protein
LTLSRNPGYIQRHLSEFVPISIRIEFLSNIGRMALFARSLKIRIVCVSSS